jgi:hypothetical protein
MKIIFPILVWVLLVLVVFGVFCFGIYRLGWDNAASREFLKLVPLPAARLNGQFISLNKYYEYRDFLKPVGASSEMILDQLLENQIYQALAKKSQLKIGSQELENYYQYLLTQIGPEPEKVYGFSEAQFKELVIKPDYLQKQVQIHWLSENAGSLKSYQKILLARSELKKGMDFTEAARTFSEDEQSKYLGGDLGFIFLSELPPWIKEEVVKLPEGEMSGIVVSPQGYHIFKANVILKDKDEIQLRQIFVSETGFAEFFQKQKQAVEVLVFKGL